MSNIESAVKSTVEFNAQECNRPFLGFGLGLRTDHFHHVLEHKPKLDWFEVISENFMVAGGKPKYYLHEIRNHYPMVMHGVSLSIGSTDPLDYDYLKRLKTLINEVEPEWVSDHLCWTKVGNHNSHDLLPLPYTQESLNHVVSRVQAVQDFLGQQILLENLSSYVTFKASEHVPEWEFYKEVCERADCLQLLDINNIYVSARNHGFDPRAYVDHMNPHRVCQFHLAGHTDYGDYVIDTHDHNVVEPVWSLYAYALQRLGAVSTMIERDDNIPSFDELMAELNRARSIYTKLDESSAAELTERAERTMA